MSNGNYEWIPFYEEFADSVGGWDLINRIRSV